MPAPSSPPRYWLLNFRPDTYEIVKAAGVIGVLDSHRRRFASLGPGDRFVVYVSQRRIFDAHGRIESEPFTDLTPIFGPKRLYPWRCKVSFEQTGGAIPGDDLLWDLTAWPDPMKTTPSNYLFCYGGFLEMPEADYQAVRRVLAESVTASIPGR
ncbi:MAG: hypothetical protein ABIO70_10370 [Pseudomonadota bacterium]